VVGGAVEWMFTQSWILSGEYLYYRFDDTSTIFSLLAPSGAVAWLTNNCNWKAK
jgi:hypothetical protein